MAASNMELKLGKKPAQPNAIALKFGAYFHADELPTVPKVFGRSLMVSDWGVLANDRAGCCFWSGSAHETMLLKANVRQPVSFTDTAVLSDYSACTGFIPSDPAGTDKGTSVADGARYRQKTGIVDAVGVRHRIDIYAAMRVGDLDQLALATYLFGTVGLGVILHSTAIAQFRAGEPWSVPSDEGEELGGHYVPIVGRNRSGNFIGITWGRAHAIEPPFIQRYMDEGLAILSRERLNAMGRSPRGADIGALMRDFQEVLS